MWVLKEVNLNLIRIRVGLFFLIQPELFVARLKACVSYCRRVLGEVVVLVLRSVGSLEKKELKILVQTHHEEER